MLVVPTDSFDTNRMPQVMAMFQDLVWQEQVNSTQDQATRIILWGQIHWFLNTVWVLSSQFYAAFRLQHPLLVDLASQSQNSEQGALHSLKFQGTGVACSSSMLWTLLCMIYDPSAVLS
jgi:hypothetical protein